MGKIANEDIRQLRAIGHKLKPVVTVAGNGVSEPVLAEIERALGDHELIKIKLAAGDRETRAQMTAEICRQSSAQLVQSIGNVALLLRRSPQPDPRLSNLIRKL
jgi:RNA-binding protein